MGAGSVASPRRRMQDGWSTAIWDEANKGLGKQGARQTKGRAGGLRTCPQKGLSSYMILMGMLRQECEVSVIRMSRLLELTSGEQVTRRAS